MSTKVKIELKDASNRMFAYLEMHSTYVKAKQKNRGMFETQKSGSRTSSGEIGRNMRTRASPKVGQDQVSVVSVLC